MSLARLVITAVRVRGALEGRGSPGLRGLPPVGPRARWPVRCRGEASLEPRSRRPRRSPHRTLGVLEDEIVALRKELEDQGLDAGARTIAYHLTRRHGEGSIPSSRDDLADPVAPGLGNPAAREATEELYVRFAAEMPNERWQADITHWTLAGGAEVEILNVLDDHSRFLVACDARVVFKAADIIAHLPWSRCGPRVPGIAAHR